MNHKQLKVILAGLAAALITACAEPSSADDCRPLPEFTQTSPDAWFNSAPLKRDSLRGKVVLVDVWTFACWNCYRSIPWLRQVEARFAARGLQVVGIHTPEFDYEKKRQAVGAHVRKHKLAHPVMMDNNFAYWRALGNQYWPAFYVADRKGCIRATFVGETHIGTRAARKIETSIEKLLADK